MFKIVVFMNLQCLLEKSCIEKNQTKAPFTFRFSSRCVLLYLCKGALQQGLKIITDSLKIRKLLQLQSFK